MSNRSDQVDRDESRRESGLEDDPPARSIDADDLDDSSGAPGGGSTTTADDESTTSARPDPSAPTATVSGGERRRLVIQLLIVSAAVTFGLFLVYRGISAGITGDARAKYPPEIESVTPVPDAVQAFGSDSIEVDLAPGYIGEITIDGIPIDTVKIGDYIPADVQPGEQIELPPVAIYEPGNATLVFTPSASAPIEEFTIGKHSVRVDFWKLVDGRQRVRTYTWEFNVK